MAHPDALKWKVEVRRKHLKSGLYMPRYTLSLWSLIFKIELDFYIIENIFSEW